MHSRLGVVMMENVEQVPLLCPRSCACLECSNTSSGGFGSLRVLGATDQFTLRDSVHSTDLSQRPRCIESLERVKGNKRLRSQTFDISCSSMLQTCVSCQFKAINRIEGRDLSLQETPEHMISLPRETRFIEWTGPTTLDALNYSDNRS